ncbi:MAG: NAD(P)-dependent oxidoreductase [Bacteroidota bacterium]
MKVTFIGLGIMGSRMAANLLKQGTELTVWNRTLAAANIPELQGATVADSIQGAVAGAEVVFSMLSTPEAVATCFFGKTGALAKMDQGAMWVDCSTVNPAFSRRAAQEANTAKVRFIDAPVAGSKPQAEAAQLAFFLGADSATFAPIRHCLEAMGTKIIPFGTAGQGSAFKMVVNMMLAQSMVVFSEAVLLGERLGIDREFLLNTIPKLPVIAPFTAFKADAIRHDDYAVNFPLELLLKDLHLATTSAYAVGQPLPLANLTKELYAAANRAGLGREDFAAVFRQLAGA